jgi:type VI secretion system ImpA/VasJ family protein
MSIEEKFAVWCQPVAEGSFGGEPSRYDEKYEQLLTEIGKADAVTGDNCKWNVVFDCADVLLRTKTKDMTPLGALCIALYKRDGFLGLATGLGAFASLVQTHSEDMFPKPQRQRGRAGAYTWLTERLIRELETAQVGGADVEALQLTKKYFEDLDNMLRPQLGDLHPRIGPLTRALQILLDQATAAVAPPPEPEPPPPPVEEQAAPASEDQSGAPVDERAAVAEPPPPPPPPAAGLPETIESDEQAQSVLEKIAAACKRLAAFYLDRSAQSALGWHLALVGSLLGVAPDGDRRVQTPSPRRLRELQESANDRRWDDVVRAVIELIREGESDVDLNAAACAGQALEGLGHELALNAVTTQALAHYWLMGEMAAASGETAAWLEGMAGASSKPAPGGGGETAAAEAEGAGDGARKLEDLIKDATNIAKRRGLDEGCAVILGELDKVASKAKRFRLRLALASICLESQAADLARPILQDLFKELEDPVRAWDPVLLVEVVSGLLGCNRQLREASKEAAPGLDKESAELMGLLSRVDPQAAIRERTKGQ